MCGSHPYKLAWTDQALKQTNIEMTWDTAPNKRRQSSLTGPVAQMHGNILRIKSNRCIHELKIFKIGGSERVKPWRNCDLIY